MSFQKRSYNKNRSDSSLFVNLLKKNRKLLQTRSITCAISSALTVFLALFTIVILFEHFLYLDNIVKSLLLLLFLTASLGTSLYLIKLGRLSSLQKFYTDFSDRYDIPELKYLLDLSIYTRFRETALYEAAKKQNFEALGKTNISGLLNEYSQHHSTTRNYRYGLIAAALALLFTGSVSFYFSNSTSRVLAFWKDFTKPNPFHFAIQPGNTTIEQGALFKPTISFTGNKVPESVTLAIKTAVETDFRKLKMQSVNTNKFEASGIQLSNNSSYYIEMDAFKSSTFDVNIQLRPRFEDLAVTVQPPGYTRLEPKTYTYPFSSIPAYIGSELSITGKINKPLKKLQLHSVIADDTTNLELNENNVFTLKRPLLKRDTLFFTMQDKSGLENKNRFSFAIDVLQDEYPFISITKPEGELSLAKADSVTINYEASDDFGLHSATLNYQVNRAFINEPLRGNITLSVPALNRTEVYDWNLNAFDLKPRDELVYWIKVRDNDKPNGFKAATSQKMVIRIPSLTEHFDEIEEKESETQQTLEEISESYRDIQKQYEEFKNQLIDGNEDKWQQNKQLEQIKEDRKKLNEKVQKLNKEFENLRKNLEKQNLMSEETLKTYKELEKLMKEIDDPEILKLIEEMQKSLDQFNQNQLREAMEKMEFNEKAYQERLKRTVELFKKLKLNSDLEKMARSLENLSDQEKQLSETKNPPAVEAKKQQAIDQDLTEIRKNLDKLNENAPENNRSEIEELQKEGERNLNEISKKINQNIEDLKRLEQQGQQASENETRGGEQGENRKQQNQQQIQEQQEQIQQQMKAMAQKMRQSQQQMQQQQLQINIAALESILHGLLNQSYQQESLTKETEELAERSRAFVEKARIQKNISNQFAQLSDSLSAVASEVPMLSNTITEKKLVVERELKQAVEQLAERNRQQSTIAERQALGGINELASMVASLLDQLNNMQGQGGMGGMSVQQMMQQMQNMSGQQQKLNQQLQQMINDIQGQRLSQDQMERLNQLARQQNKIRKQLEELKRSGGLEPGDKLLSEMERLAEEMEQAINDIRGGSVDRPFIKRQQNILSRMLEAEKALQERGKSKKEREADSPEDTPPAVSPDITLEELRQMIRKRLQDPDQTNFTRDYQELIETYFKLLEEQKKIPS